MFFSNKRNLEAKSAIKVYRAPVSLYYLPHCCPAFNAPRLSGSAGSGAAVEALQAVGVAGHVAGVRRPEALAVELPAPGAHTEELDTLGVEAEKSPVVHSAILCQIVSESLQA